MEKMDKDKQITLIINLLTGFILLGSIVVICYIYRENIYNFLDKTDKGDADEIGALISGSDNQQPEESSAGLYLDSSTTEEETTEPEREYIKYISAPKSDFMKNMFDSAVEIPGCQDKIEPPPRGRREELHHGIVPLSELIPHPSEYFKDIIFLGDSVTTGFDLYRNRIEFNGENILGEVTVIAVASYGAFNAIKEISKTSVHPVFEGEQTYPEDIIAKKDAKNIFICLGLNDLTWAKTDKFITYYETLIKRIKEKNPDKNIVIMSVTPVVAGEHPSTLNNNIVSEANDALLNFARENNIRFIDYGAAIRDDENNLYSEFSSDNYCHLKIAAYNRLVEYMLYHPVKY